MSEYRKGLTAGWYVPDSESKHRADSHPHALITIPPSFAAQPMVTVPDVSFWDDDNQTPRGVDYAQMKANGARGVILRAGQGNWVDEDFEVNWRAARAAGLPFGTYWYYDPRVDWKQQALTWSTLIAESQPELDNWPDYEYPAAWGGAFAGWQRLYDFQERLKVLSVERLTIYTGYYWWFDNVISKTTAAQLAYFKQFPLALAWYTQNMTLVKIPQPWDEATWRWHQFTDQGNGLAYGAESLGIDLNHFNGLEADFVRVFGGTPPPPTGGTMHYGTLKSFTNIRSSAPGGTYQDIGDLLANDEVVADVIQNVGGYNWWHLTGWSRGGVVQTLPAGDCWAYGVNITEHAPPATGTKITLEITQDAAGAVTGVSVDGVAWVKP